MSVIIPTYNRAHVLERAVRSALDQTIRDLEVLVVDDGSTDGTQRLVASFAAPRVRYFRHDTRRGAPAARNTGIKEARGCYHAFLDSDDEWSPTKLERQLILMEETNADVATCGISRAGTESVSIPASSVIDYEALLAFEGGGWGGQTIVVRRNAVTSRVEFDETLPSGQDWDYVIRLAQVTKVVSVQDVLVKVHKASGDRIGSLETKLKGRKMLRRKYDAELRTRPRALAAHEVGLGVLSVFTGARRAGRRHLAAALSARPLDVRVAILLVASFLGRRILRRTFRCMPIGTRVG